MGGQVGARGTHSSHPVSSCFNPTKTNMRSSTLTLWMSSMSSSLQRGMVQAEQGGGGGIGMIAGRV